ncbi:MAG: hypothetical protein LCH30_05515 [Proteobacteria bacterium]|nr:hypothetical protein [Pseudomonadota bacterium]
MASQRFENYGSPREISTPQKLWNAIKNWFTNPEQEYGFQKFRKSYWFGISVAILATLAFAATMALVVLFPPVAAVFAGIFANVGLGAVAGLAPVAFAAVAAAAVAAATVLAGTVFGLFQKLYNLINVKVFGNAPSEKEALNDAKERISNLENQITVLEEARVLADKIDEFSQSYGSVFKRQADNSAHSSDEDEDNDLGTGPAV